MERSIRTRKMTHVVEIYPIKSVNVHAGPRPPPGAIPTVSSFNGKIKTSFKVFLNFFFYYSQLLPMGIADKAKKSPSGGQTRIREDLQ